MSSIIKLSVNNFISTIKIRLDFTLSLFPVSKSTKKKKKKSKIRTGGKKAWPFDRGVKTGTRPSNSRKSIFIREKLVGPKARNEGIVDESVHEEGEREKGERERMKHAKLREPES